MQGIRESFRLAKPSIAHKERAIEYIREHQKMKSEINGAGGLSRYVNNYEKWLRISRRRAKYSS